ncbi:diacylglycerol kinase family enzyme [Kineococcus rhizosphaerae]|uniref:Diacylglycerol kinase family enzyme n=1 Tax=Kineococcus rhizosphaerae TaxID=559628 RepID=A0A2T0R0V2_9ACTN|nr:diacylglycerol kinase family enzyme [Kineococcus rhizosphaerae]
MPRVNGYLAIVNAAAGSARADAVEAVVGELGRAGDVELRRTGDLHDLRNALLSADGRRLVLLGGDGSLHAALQLLWDAGRTRDVGPLGVVPLGTGNDLARSLRLPLDPVAAARVAATGRPRGLELLVDSHQRITVNTVHAGIGASATAKAQRLKKGLGVAAYPVGAAWAGISAGRGFALRVEVDGKVLTPPGRPVLMAGIGIGGTIGGGTPLVPGADPHDGLADVVVSTSTGPLARLGFAAGLRRGVHVERQDVVTATGKVVEIRAEDGTFRLNSDGEVTDPQTSERWEMHADVWQVVCP